MFEADMVTPCGLDCNICSQALIENDPYKSCKQVIEAAVKFDGRLFF